MGFALTDEEQDRRLQGVDGPIEGRGLSFPVEREDKDGASPRHQLVPRHVGRVGLGGHRQAGEESEGLPLLRNA